MNWFLSDYFHESRKDVTYWLVSFWPPRNGGFPTMLLKPDIIFILIIRVDKCSTQTVIRYTCEYSCMATVEDFARTLMLDKNLILEGPPGTGKTFAIKEICSELTKNGHTLLKWERKFATTFPNNRMRISLMTWPNTDTIKFIAPTMTSY